MHAVRSPLRAWGLVVVRGRSMRPTLWEGDRLVVRHGATPRPGDLVVCRLPDGVVAVKRATLRQVLDGQHGDRQHAVVAPGATGWWVERDNPDEGVDSWRVGAIPDADVLAVVRARWWPWRRGRLRRPPGPG